MPWFFSQGRFGVFRPQLQSSRRAGAEVVEIRKGIYRRSGLNFPFSGPQRHLRQRLHISVPYLACTWRHSAWISECRSASHGSRLCGLRLAALRLAPWPVRDRVPAAIGTLRSARADRPVQSLRRPRPGMARTGSRDRFCVKWRRSS